MIKSKKPELLAPAGDLSKLKTALAFGADAVYFGLPNFSLRARINDFSWQDIKTGINLAHQLKKKAYVTLNIFAHNYHLTKLKSHIKKLKKLKPDAIILADPGVLTIVKDIYPEATIILSTQANCSNIEAVNFWQKQGIKRIILSRELSIKEVSEISKKYPKIEIETFIHGALCLAYSGRCFLSQYFLGRNANLGDCVQPCRWEYELRPLGKEKSLIAGENNNGTYLLNSLDLCLIKRIEEMSKAGIKAFKIEGRAKSVYYLANVVGAYRQAIDLVFSNLKKIDKEKQLAFLFEELNKKLFHRGLSEGLMFAKDNNQQNVENSKNSPDWEFCGQVIKSLKVGDKKFAVFIKVHNSLKIGDKVELISPPYNLISWTIKEIYKTDRLNKITEAHGGGGGQEVVLFLNKEVPPLSVLRRHL
jgi:U32 family peptidase